MRTLRILALALVTAGGTAHAQQPSPTPPPRLPVFPTGVEQVVVDVVVVDAQGRPVTGLSAEDFVLTEDGAPREIVSFEAVAPDEAGAPDGAPQARLTRAFGVVFDDLHLTPDAGERVKGALAQLLTAVLRESDEVAIVRTSTGQAWAGRVGADRASLNAALANLRGLRPRPKACEMSDEEAMQIHVERNEPVRQLVFDRLVKCRLLIRPPVSLIEGGGAPAAPAPIRGGESQLDTWADDQHQRTVSTIRATYRTVEGLLRALSPLRGRKSVILASEGFVRDRGLSEEKGLVNAASEANAAVYFLDARASNPLAVATAADAPVAPDTSEMGRIHQREFLAAEATELLAQDTGGRVIRGGDLAQGLRRLADESRAYYLLGYAPAGREMDGRFRAIRVSVKRPGLEARARRGYYAVPRAGPPPPNVEAAAAAAPAPKPVQKAAPAMVAAAPPVASGPLAAYTAGLAGARSQVAAWSAEQTEAALAALKAGAPADDVVETAALAHASAAMAGGQEHHARAAAQAAALIRDAVRRRALEARVLLGLAHGSLDARRWPLAQELAERAADRVGDADALLVLGIVQETTGSVVDGGRRPTPDQAVLLGGFDEMVSRNPVTGFAAGVPGGPAGRAPEFRSPMSRMRGPSAEARLRRAAEAYRRALKARPALPEAHLRLGRTLALLGETKDALAELEAASAAGDTDTKYLAGVFTGDLEEQRGDLAAAAARYRAALEARPASAVARLALASVLHAAGDRAGSQAALQELLLAPRRDEAGDPWWRYRLRPLGRWGDALAEAGP